MSLPYAIRRHSAIAATITILALLKGAPDADAATLCDTLQAGRVDILYVLPDSFVSHTSRLALHRSNYQGYSSVIVRLEGLSGCGFSNDRRLAIRELILRTMTEWAAPPKHVVLVGTYEENPPYRNVIPTWQLPDSATAYPWGPYVSTDDPYVFGPESSDSLPQISLGRIPAHSIQELGDYVDKVIEYENQGSASWKAASLHIIDDNDCEGIPGGLVAAHAESLATSYAGRELFFNRTFLYGRQIGSDCGAVSNVGNGLANSRMNEGVGFVLVNGSQGGSRMWGFYGNHQRGECSAPRGSTTSDTLTVNGRSAVALSLVCGGAVTRTDFNVPDTSSRCESLAGYLLFSPRRGLVVDVGPSAAIRENGAHAVGREWMRFGFASGGPFFVEPGITLQKAKVAALSHEPEYRNEIHSFMNLGDPALQMYIHVAVVDAGVAPGREVTVDVKPLATPSREPSIGLSGSKPGLCLVTLFDARGRRLRSQPVTISASGTWQRVAFDRPGLPTGLYFVSASLGGARATTKLVLVK